ncbi:polysaccharide pyruvyl transferase family protein [Rubrivirga sp. IMCC43871]|uniref:polysaccharide pyruvyl transferase family protein n=1 Tax=Rubrivirga sp. IMCC43871 TaxID=3391575 RepID=UPI0039900883
MPTPPRTLRVAVTNVTLGNGGDAAILFGLERALRAALPPFDMVLLETQPSVAAPAYPQYDVRVGFASLAFPQIAKGIPARAKRAARYLTRNPRLRLAARAWRAGQHALALRLAGADGAASFRAVAEADVVVSTGGTYFVPAYWLGPRLLEFEVLHAMDQPYALYTQSVGPIGDDMPRRRLGAIFARARTVLLRGEPSQAEVLALAPGAATHVRADAAFALAEADVLAAARERAWPERPQVAISVRDWPHFRTTDAAEGMDRFRRSVAALATHLVREHGASVTFLSTCQGRPGYRFDDSAVGLEIRALVPEEARASVTVDREARDPIEMRDAYAAMDLVVATRMHAAILALAAGTPVLPVAYEHKTHELFGALGVGGWVTDIETITPEAFVATADRVLGALPDARTALFEGVEGMRLSAMGAGALVAEAFAAEIAAAS